jgi:hypothetical protein
MNRHQLGGAALVLIGGAIFWEARRHGLGGFGLAGTGAIAATLAAALGGIGALVLLFGSDPAVFSSRSRLVILLGILLACSFVASAIDVLGYRASVAIAVIFLFGAIEGRHPAAVLGAAIGLAFGSQYLLEATLPVALPRGFLSF